VRTDDPFYPPMTYSVWWTILAVLLLIGVLGWIAFVWWSTRRAVPRTPPAPLAPPPGWIMVRAKHDTMATIDRLVWQAENGVLDVREAHQELSRTVRGFVDQVSGTTAQTMTLSELGRSGPRMAHVSQVVHQLYPGEFGPDPARPIRPAAEAAKAVVAAWH